MPLFHIHGLIAAVLSSLAAGASVWCAPGFNALKAFSWLDEVDPTWYTAVPTMHQALLARAPRNKEIVEKLNLRLIRSSSSSLPPQVMAALEETFGCPVLESYGMTEAAHQMAATPLPPAARKPGAVGIAAGPEVAIMNDAGELLPQGEIGEVVIQGPNVTKGYENNDEANATAFTNGWFRTGDQGALDEEGYLRLTGRLKEIINRGGEKISPLEVDEVIMDHPAVAQCVTFAMPHKSLGEDVAAAVVLKEGQTADEAEIRKFVQSRIADFKAPRKVIVLDEIPKGATGKLQRIGLAEKLGLG
jgi:acyl-CoA synthetase (AMP-forming)/AMP-acid ligase II